MRSETAAGQLVGVEGVSPVVAGCEEYRYRSGVCQRDARLVAVVHRLEHHDLVACVEHAEQCAGQCLGGAGGDDDLARRVEVDPVPALLVFGDRHAQLRHPGPWWILVDAGADGLDRCVEHLGRPVGVGKSLAEVDRTGLDGQRGHLSEDRGAEAGEFVGERIGRCHVATVGSRAGSSLRQAVSRLRRRQLRCSSAASCGWRRRSGPSYTVLAFTSSAVNWTECASASR